MTDKQFRDFARKLAIEVYGETGRWIQDKADEINRRFFRGKLPPVWVSIEIMPYGKCLGTSRTPDEGRPVIRLAKESLLGSKRTPQGGLKFSEDVLLHEHAHVSVERRIGRGTGTSSHNCDGWVAEVNRISPLIGLDHIQAGRAKSVRRQIGWDSNGKPEYEIKRMTPDDCIPLAMLSSWPHSCRPTSYYRD